MMIKDYKKKKKKAMPKKKTRNPFKGNPLA